MAVGRSKYQQQVPNGEILKLSRKGESAGAQMSNVKCQVQGRCGEEDWPFEGSYVRKIFDGLYFTDEMTVGKILIFANGKVCPWVLLLSLP